MDPGLSGFSKIPYTYNDCVASIPALDPGEHFNRAVFFENARGLLEI
jgi:hypothetical protein